MMEIKYVCAPDAHDLKTGYSQAVEVRQITRTLYISGQIPVRPDGSTPESFEDQARQTWANVEAQLKAADMSFKNVVKHTTYLSERKYRNQNSQIRRELFGNIEPALTVIICGIFDEGWLLEIEAVATD